MVEPTPTSASTPITADQRRAAQAALAGSDWIKKRDDIERRKVVEAELLTLKTKKAEIIREKETLELGWIEQDNKRRAIRAVLNPLLDQEKKVETEEQRLEEEEAKIGLAADKRVVEEKRGATQDERREIEKKKWAEEAKLAEIEKVVQANTQQYRKWLDEEEAADKREQELNLELANLNKPDAGGQ